MHTSPLPPPDDLLKLCEAARLLKCNPATVHRWISTGKLPGWRRVGTWFVSKADCIALFRKGARKPRVPLEQSPDFQRQADHDMKSLERFGIHIPPRK